MTKSNYTLPTSTNQPTSDNAWDFEDEFCRRINKIRGVSDLFFCVGEGSERQLKSEGAFGLHYILEDCSEELRAICYRMLRWKEDREDRLERTMKDFIDYLEAQADDIDPKGLRQMAANLRGVLGQGGAR